VPYYSATGCAGCAAAAGAVVGATVGVAAASASAARPVAYPVLPAGCAYRPFVRAYDCGTVWLAASYGASGVYYTPIPPP